MSLVANAQVNTLFVDHTVPQILEHADRYKSEIREKQQQLRDLVGSRYHDLIDVSEAIILMQQQVQQFETGLEDLVQDTLSESSLEFGAFHVSSQHQNQRSLFYSTQVQQNGYECDENTVLQRATRACDFLATATHAQLVTPETSRIFAENWKLLHSLNSQSFSHWRHVVVGKMQRVQRSKTAALELDLARPLLRLSEATSLLESLHECMFSLESGSKSGYDALIHHFLHVIRTRALQPAATIESFLVTLFLTPLLFNGKLRYESIIRSLQNWIDSSREVVSRCVCRGDTPAELLAQEGAVRALFEPSTFESLVSKESLVSSAEMTQLQWKQKWTDIKKDLGVSYWNLYESRLLAEFTDRQQQHIESVVTSQLNGNGLAVASVRKQPVLVQHWKTAYARCKPLLDTRPSNAQLFSRLWQQDLERFLNQNADNVSVSRAHDIRRIKRFVTQFQPTQVDKPLLDRFDALYMACFQPWIESIAQQFSSQLKMSNEHKLWQHAEAMQAGWKDSPAAGGGEHSLRVVLPINATPSISAALFEVNTQISNIGADKIERSVIDKLASRLAELSLTVLATKMSSACCNEAYALQFLFDVQFLIGSLLGSTYEKFAFKPEEQLSMMDSRFVALVRSVLEGEHIDPINWEIYDKEFHNNLKSCLARHALYPLQMRHWRSLVTGANATSARAALTEPSSHFLGFMDVSHLPLLKPVAATVAAQGISQPETQIGSDLGVLKLPVGLKPGVLPLDDNSDRLLFSTTEATSIPNASVLTRSSSRHERVASGEGDSKGVLGSIWSSFRRVASTSEDLGASPASTPPAGSASTGTPSTPAASAAAASTGAVPPPQSTQQSQRARFFGLFSG